MGQMIQMRMTNQMIQMRMTNQVNNAKRALIAKTTNHARKVFARMTNQMNQTSLMRTNQMSLMRTNQMRLMRINRMSLTRTNQMSLMRTSPMKSLEKRNVTRGEIAKTSRNALKEFVRMSDEMKMTSQMNQM